MKHGQVIRHSQGEEEMSGCHSDVFGAATEYRARSDSVTLCKQFVAEGTVHASGSSGGYSVQEWRVGWREGGQLVGWVCRCLRECIGGGRGECIASCV